MEESILTEMLFTWLPENVSEMRKSEAVTPARAKIEASEGSGFAEVNCFSRL